jgi:hypothetical protein
MVTLLDGASTIGTGYLSTAGTFTLSLSNLSAGVHSITARYAGDPTHLAGGSTAFLETIGFPAYTLSLNPSTLNLGSSARGTVQVILTPTYGFNQPVVFSSSGLPPNASGAFSVAAATPDGTNTAVSVSFTVADDGLTAALSRPPPPGRFQSIFAPISLAGLLLMLFTRLDRSRPSLRARLGAVGAAIAIFLPIALLSGCGAGIIPPTASVITPRGNYTISIAGSSGQSVSTTPLTLNIN